MTQLKNISKSRFLATLNCPLMGWGLRHGLIKSIPEDDYFSLFLATQGHVVGDYSTQAWDKHLISKGFDPSIASINVDEELAKLGVTREDPAEWLTESVRITQTALKDRNIRAIYEATIHMDEYTTRADILHRDSARHHWKIIELKSITSYDSFTDLPRGYRDSRPKYIDDMAYTNMVFCRANIPIRGVFLLNINKSCNSVNLEITSDSPQPNAFFNLSTEFNQAVVNQTLDFDGYWDYVKEITSNPEPPSIEFGLMCKKCSMCSQYLDSKNNNYIFNIPFASAAGSLSNKLTHLVNNGIYHLEDTPPFFFDEFRKHRENRREQTAAIVTECTKQNKPYVRTVGDDGGLARLLSTIPGDSLSLEWPVIYLDFEFMGTAVPLWDELRDENNSLIQPGVKPYEAVPVQYSLHLSKIDQNNNFPYPIHLPAEPVLEKSFISHPSQDMRLKMAVQLATDLREITAKAGVKLEDCSIVVWHQTAELSCLNYFVGGTEKYPDPLPWLPGWAVETLQIARDNIVDLLNIVRGGKVKPAVPRFKTKLNFYHPAFRGSFSLKSVIKMFSGVNPYQEGSISSGSEAFAKYGELVYAFSGKASNYWSNDDYTAEDIQDIMVSLESYCRNDTYSLYRVHKELVLQARKCLLGSNEFLKYTDIPFSTDFPICLRCHCFKYADMTHTCASLKTPKPLPARFSACLSPASAQDHGLAC